MRRIEGILISSRFAIGLPALEDDELKLHTRSWFEILEPVAIDWLHECYIRAMRNHDPARPFGAVEILNVWNSVLKNGEYDVSRMQAVPYIAETEKFCPDQCSSSGWYTVHGNGTVENPAGYEYAKPCPVHRPQEFVKYPQDAPWNGQTRTKGYEIV